MSYAPQTTPPEPLFSIKRVALVAIPLAVVAATVLLMVRNRIEWEAQRSGEETMLNWFEMASPSPRLLDSRFSDADADLVADPPTSPAEQLSPDVLYFSYVGGPEAKEESEMWRDFADHLAEATGKEIQLKSFSTTQEQLSALATGGLHVTSFNTGAVPLAVASCGFVPVCTLGKEDGTFGTTMRIIVPAKSDIKSVLDLKGHPIAFTTRDSNSGCKAALALLREFGLLPLRDFLWKFSGSHDASIKGVSEGYYHAAPVAGDLLDRAVASGKISSSEFQTIYESEVFPPATAGYVYYLAPELREAIESALLEFDWSGTPLEELFAAQGVTKFVPVSYKQDFALIRRLDDAFRKPLVTASN